MSLIDFNIRSRKASSMAHSYLIPLAAIVSGLHESEEKVQSYEARIEQLKGDMIKMERTLQDDINSLTMKNSILSSLLEAINHHEGTESLAAPSLRGSSSGSSSSPRMDSASNSTPSRVAEGSGLTSVDMDTEAFLSRHISRLPTDIQVGEVWHCNFSD